MSPTTRSQSARAEDAESVASLSENEQVQAGSSAVLPERPIGAAGKTRATDDNKSKELMSMLQEMMGQIGELKKVQNEMLDSQRKRSQREVVKDEPELATGLDGQREPEPLPSATSNSRERQVKSPEIQFRENVKPLLQNKDRSVSAKADPVSPLPLHIVEDPLFGISDKTKHDLTGIKLRLPKEDLLSATSSWRNWSSIIRSGMEATGWIYGNSLSVMGEANLCITIRMNVTEPVKRQILDLHKGSEMYYHLRNTYYQPSQQRSRATLDEFREMTYQKGENAAEFVGHHRALMTKFETSYVTHEHLVIDHFYSAVQVNARYWALRKREMSEVVEQSIEKLYEDFLLYAQSSGGGKGVNSGDTKKGGKSHHAEGSSSKKDKKKLPLGKVLCYNCGKYGHYSNDCENDSNKELVEKRKAELSKKKGSRQEGVETSNTSSAAPKPSSFATQRSQLIASVPEGGSLNFCYSAAVHTQRDLWLWDSGSNIHITNDLNDMHQPEELHVGDFPINTGGGTVHPTHVGTVGVKFTGPGGKGVNACHMKLAVCIPQMPVKIVSGEKMFEAGGRLDGLVVVLPNGQRLTELNPQRRGFILWEAGKPEPRKGHPSSHMVSGESHRDHMIGVADEDAELLKSSLQLHTHVTLEGLSDDAVRQLTLWHRRLGHCSAERLRWTVQKCTGIDVETSIIVSLPCNACDQAKITKIPSHDGFLPATYAGESIHVDLGTISPISVDGKRYFALRTDLHSRLRKLNFHAKKSEFSACLMHDIEDENRRLAALSRSVSIVHIDGARELTNEGISGLTSTFEKFCRDNHIKLTISSPQNHHQNPYAERGIRLLQDSARAMSIQMRVPSVFWPQLLDAAAYIANRTASRSLNGDVPQKVYDRSMEGCRAESSPRAINLGHLRVIGCLCTTFVEPTERVSAEKLDPRGVKSILLGFNGTHNYLVWLIDGGRFLRTPNVIFTEHVGNGVIGGTGVPEMADPRQVVRSLPPAVQKRLRHRTKPKSSIKTRDLNTVDEDVTGDEGNLVPRRGRPKRTPQDVFNGLCMAPEEHEVFYQHLHDGLLNCTATSSNPKTPTIKQALQGVERAEWLLAMNKEITQLLERGTFEFVKTRPPNIVSTKWVLVKKLLADGSIDKFKARLVARGFSQRVGIDYFSTTASTSITASWRTCLALAAVKGWHVVQTDFVGAYLAGDLEETIHMSQFEGLNEFFRSQPDLVEKSGWSDEAVIRLRRPLYGLKQSGANWQKKIRGMLERVNIWPLNSDDAVYQSSTDQFIVVSHVDDFLLIGPDRKVISTVLENLRVDVDCSEENAEWFLGYALFNSRDAFNWTMDLTSGK